MRRDLPRLANTTFDLLVVGAGIHGACAAWDASLRGLSVAVVDQDDFGGATSANSLGIVHGGLRYLARGDFPRTLESIQERSALLRIAPALVEPLAVLVPTHGRGSRSRSAYRAALAVNDLVSVLRNRDLDPDRLIPRSRLISRAACLALFPWFSPARAVTGGALWYDAKMRCPERLTLSFLRSADHKGAVLANYVRVESLRTEAGAATGAAVKDQLTGETFDIRARSVLVAAGHWTQSLINLASGTAREKPWRSHALGVNVTLDRRLADVAVGVQARSGPEADPVCGGRRFLFLAPHESTTMLGTWYAVPESADSDAVAELGARTLVHEINEVCPGIALGMGDVVRLQSGWLPLKAGVEPGRSDALAERPRVLDHGRSHGIRKLFSVEGVKYTTARRVAQRAVDQVFHAQGRRSPPCRTSETALDTGPISGPDILHAVREEMAVTLSDAIFRRTGLGAAPGPKRPIVQEAAVIMGTELGWDSRREQSEVEAVMRQAEVPGQALEAVG